MKIHNTHMAEIESKTKLKVNLFWYYAIGVIVIWSFFIGMSVFWHQKTMHTGALNAARIEAAEAFQNHITYRSWNTGHGGVYVPVTEETQPNPYLDTPERDIQTPSGVKLTKVNPAFMTRQANELALKKFGYIGHITSLNPLRPENKPDIWETSALTDFEQGQKEVSSLEIIKGEPYLRLMRPLITEKGCLPCHAKQGYKQGEIRGGISVAVPMKPHFDIEKINSKNSSLMYFSIWLTGFIGILLFTFVLNRQIEQRLKAEADLRYQEKLEGVVEMARAVCHELNQPLQMILGNSEIILLDDIDRPTLLKRTRLIKEQVDRMGEMTRKLIKIANYETKDLPQGKVIDIEKSSR